ncbi:MAG: cytochrome c3 family protein [Rhizobacter sp.]
MPQVFSRRAALAVKLGLVALLVPVAGVLAGGVWREHAYQAIGEPIAQPIPFSHKHHVGDDGIDCRYCHTTVENGRYAGLPSTHVCLTCHSQLYRDAPVLQPLHDSARSGEPVRWQRVHELPDFVFFNHGVHVAKGVACFECHGRVDQMPLTWRARPLQMQWCLSCHRDPAPHLRPPSQVVEMTSAARGGEAGRQLAAALHLESRRRLTDCSTCHR